MGLVFKYNNQLPNHGCTVAILFSLGGYNKVLITSLEVV